jgi:hypothetical protein
VSDTQHWIPNFMRLRRAICAFRGHRLDLIVCFARGRLMRCEFCGHLEVTKP